MKKYVGLMLLLVSSCMAANAQFWPSPRVVIVPGRPHHYQRAPQRRPSKPKAVPFQPTVNLTFGYGFPSTDQYALTSFYNTYKGNIKQTGPFTGTIDFQFSPNMSIGVMGTYSKVKARYYDAYAISAAPPTAYGNLESTSVMFNLVNYIPVSKNVTPYFRTAAGINIWNQHYEDASGSKLNHVEKPSAFAYQASFGARFGLSQQAGIFLEAGYGKYIVNGGLSLKF